MKSDRRLFVFLAALALQAIGVTLLFAQDQSSPGGTGGIGTAANPPGQGMHGPLTPEERAHWKKVEKEVLAADPALKAEHDDLNQQRQDLDDQGASASADAKKALMAKWHDYMQKVRAAALKLDPTLAPIFAKMDQWRKDHPYPGPGGAKPTGT